MRHLFSLISAARRWRHQITEISRAGQSLDVLRAADRHVEVGYQSIGQRIDPSVDAQFLTTRPCLLHDDIGRDVPHLSNDIELAQTVKASPPVRDSIKLMAMLIEDLADGVQPV